MVRSFMAVLSLVALVAGGSACASSADVGTALQIVDVTSGWFDAGIVEGGKNKLVPSVSFRLTNVSDREIGNLQLNAVFRRVNEAEEWGSAFVRVFREPLGSKRTGDPIVMRSPLGYTGDEPRAQMLQNSQFVDATVQIFAKHGSAQWVKIGEYRIRRQLLTS
ncbi:MAG: hypothetical protein HY654_10850 [Acidobacteria bacterium]|nr:hypothetical protein [Acidobacteriota bacterium]